MRSLSSALSAALASPVQKPALLAEIGFATTRRWTSHAQITWNSQTWTTQAMRIAGLQVDALRVSGALAIDNRDGTIGALVLSEGIQDKTIKLWGYDAAATAAADVVWLCEAVGAGATITETEVVIQLRHPGEFVLSPRTFVTAAAGFSQLLPEGALLTINGQDYRLERR